jgi:hypothetical protein
MLRKMTIQEPTFERMIVVYRYVFLYSYFPLSLNIDVISYIQILHTYIVAFSDSNNTGRLAQKVNQNVEYM